MISASPVELAVLISAVAAAIATVVRVLLVMLSGLTAMYAKTPSRRRDAKHLAGLLLTSPRRRGRTSDPRTDPRDST